ncbi:hypothetical protein LAZ67_20000177 [Cordylochernes scorpioides]|uniref:Uncharacterized protein n=1 Tax=Cordylochernes scorpioides TaxID=51811 RepID=A0ABY6LLI5_9ARAC|nr:hypothetical protein LAZ67_20000177 [Cordylochernes scorpioides]
MFRSMTHGLAEQHFTSYEEAKNWVNVRIASKDENFFRHGIRMLPERWEKVPSPRARPDQELKAALNLDRSLPFGEFMFGTCLMIMSKNLSIRILSSGAPWAEPILLVLGRNNDIDAEPGQNSGIKERKCWSRSKTDSVGADQRQTALEQIKDRQCWSKSKTYSVGADQRQTVLEQIKDRQRWSRSKTDSVGANQRHTVLEQIKDRQCWKKSKTLLRYFKERQRLSRSKKDIVGADQRQCWSRSNTDSVGANQSHCWDISKTSFEQIRESIEAVKQDGGMARKDFIKQLALQLMRDALNMRNQAKILSRDLQVLIQKHAGTSTLEELTGDSKSEEEVLVTAAAGMAFFSARVLMEMGGSVTKRGGVGKE